MTLFKKLLLFATLPFLAFTYLFADQDIATFDVSKCIVISDGPMPRLSIPTPSGWKNAYDDPDMAEEVRKQDIASSPANITLAHFFNPDEIGHEATIQVIKNMQNIPVTEELFKVMRDSIAEEFGNGTIDIQKFKDIANIPPELLETVKTMKLFPIHVNNDLCLQVSLLFRTTIDGEDTLGVSTMAFINMHKRVFTLTNKKILTKDKAATDKEIENTRAFIRQWIEIIKNNNEITASDDIQFDSSNCVTLTSGLMPKVAIPAPIGWINAKDIPSLSELVKKEYIDSDPQNDTLACYVNSEDFYQEAAIKVPKMLSIVSVNREDFKNFQNEIIKKIKDGSLLQTSKIRYNDEQLKMINSTKYLPDYIKDDYSLQFTMIMPVNKNGKKSFVVLTQGVVCINSRLFSIIRKTTCKDETEVMEYAKMTQSFIKQWVEAICKENGINAESPDIVKGNDPDAVGEQNLPSLPRFFPTPSPQKSFGSRFGKIVLEGIIIAIIVGIVSLFKHKK